MQQSCSLCRAIATHTYFILLHMKPHLYRHHKRVKSDGVLSLWPPFILSYVMCWMVINSQCCLPPGSGVFSAFTPAEAGTRCRDPRGMQG